jgi:hypothetical protein
MSTYKKISQISFNNVEFGMSALPVVMSSKDRQFRAVCDNILSDCVFDSLYSKVGREARSPSVLTRLLLLQLRDHRSDEQIVYDLACDLRVRYMCDFGFDEKPIHSTQLVYHRLRLLFGTIKRDKIKELKSDGFSESDSPLQDVFDRIKQAAIELGLVDLESAQLIDSAAIFGRAAVMDSYTLIFAGIRKVLEQYQRSDDEHAKELMCRLRRREYLEDVVKPKIDWESDFARGELLNDLVHDAVSVMRTGLSFDDVELQGLLEQLARLVGQDVEVCEDGTAELIDGVSSDRQVSVVDPDMRHGRKSKSRKFDGYKGTVTADPKSGFMTAVDVMGGNEHDSIAVVPIVKQQERSGTQVPALVGDRAYAAEEGRHEAMSQGVAIVTKPNTVRTGFGKASFEIDAVNGRVTCPVGVVRKIGGQSVTFTGKGCPGDCPHRSLCLGKRGKRIIKLRKYEALQQDAEKFAQTDRGKEMLSLRPAIERVIAHWMRNGARQARYFGRLKVWMQCMLAAITCNVQKIGARLGGGNRMIAGFDTYARLFALAKILLSISMAIIARATPQIGSRRQNRRRTYRYDRPFRKTLSSGVS